MIPINADEILRKLLRFVRLYSKGVFGSLDKELNPEIFIQFYQLKDDIKYGSIPINKIKTSVNKNIELIKTLLKTKKLEFEELEKNSIQIKAITDLLIKNSDIYKNKLILTTDFYSIEGILTSVVTVLDKDIFNSYYSLKKSHHLSPLSFLDSVTSEYIQDLNKLLYNYQRKSYDSYIDFNDTIKKSAKNLLKILGYSGSTENLYNNFNKISSLNYEGKSIKGKIIFTSKENLKKKSMHKNIDLIMEFNDNFSQNNYRHVRKLLEITRDDLYLISDTKYVRGIGKLNKNYDYNNENIFIIEFTNYQMWSLKHMDIKLMDVSHDKATLPKEVIKYTDFKKKIKKVFEDLELEKIKNLYKIIIAATKQEKGTIIVISKNARSESIRLKTQGFLVKPILLNPSIMKSITSIDGAILIDTDSVCHSIGTILDGLATSKGDMSRGARYNSAIRYVETIANTPNYSDCVVIVISEDKIIDIITKYSLK